MVNGRLAAGRGSKRLRASQAGRCCALAVLAASLWQGGVAQGQVALRVHQAPEQVRVDGMLREWRGTDTERLGSGDDASMRYAVAHDDQGLYVVASVRDDRLVRTSALGRDEDAIVLTLALPRGRRLRGMEIWVYPGVAGRVGGAAALSSVGGRPRKIRQARVVEAPRAGGYRIEAFIPWKALPSTSRWERGRGAIRLQDVDSEAHPDVEAEPASAPVDRRALDRLPELVVAGTGAELLHAFMAHQNIAGMRPEADLSADMAGDDREERFVVVDRYALVFGPGFKGGRGYDYLTLPVSQASDVKDARLIDLNADGDKEALLKLRQSNAQGSREMWMAFAVGEDGMRPVWGVEVRKETDDGWVEARFDVVRSRRDPPILRVRTGRAQGLSAESLREARATDVQPIVVPWGPVLERHYQYRKGQGIQVVHERENPDYEPPAPRRRASRRRPRKARPSRPAAPSVREMLSAVKQQRGIPASARGRFAANVDVAGDHRDEHLVVYGKALVVVGPGFRGGTGYFHYEIPAASPDDVLRVSTSDLTGDGPHEVLMRIRQRFDEGVTREVLLVYCFHDGGFHRILAVEVARGQDGKWVRNRVRIVRDGKMHDIVISPGKARGWGASNWPWSRGGAEDGVHPLLLPWRDRSQRYGYVPSQGFGRKR